MHPLKLNIANTISTKKGKITSEQKTYEMWNNIVEKSNSEMSRILRMKAIQSFQTKIIYAKKLLNMQEDKTVVFTESAAQADQLCLNSYHSKNKRSEENLLAFNKGEITKLSTVKQLQEGINFVGLKTTIITHAYANQYALQQKLGRLLRLNPNETAILHILYYEGTIDEQWCKQSLKHLDPKKIFKWKKPTN